MKTLIVASVSPRRAELLTEAGYIFTVVHPNVDERTEVHDDPVQLAEALALRKAEAVAAQYPDALVLGADTLGILDSELLHKPLSKNDARAMLTALQGRTHTIVTAYAVVSKQGNVARSGHAMSEVRFRAIPNSELEAYLATEEPYDKAGGYGIQGWASNYAEIVSGNWSTVVGLPMAEVNALLSAVGVYPTQKQEAGHTAIEAVIFDADGTLVDTTDLILKGYEETLRTNGFAEFAELEHIRKCIGGTVAHTLARMLGCREDDPRIEPLVAAHDVVQDGHPEWIRSYVGTRETLTELRVRGYRVGLCTSGSMYQVRRNFRAVGIEPEELFDAIVCADDGCASKPSPEGLLLACKRLGIEPARAAYVGDHDVDMQAAKNAGLAQAIGVTHGFHTKEELEKSGADVVIGDLAVLCDLLE